MHLCRPQFRSVLQGRVQMNGSRRLRISSSLRSAGPGLRVIFAGKSNPVVVTQQGTWRSEKVQRHFCVTGAVQGGQGPV